MRVCGTSRPKSGSTWTRGTLLKQNAIDLAKYTEGMPCLQAAICTFQPLLFLPMQWVMPCSFHYIMAMGRLQWAFMQPLADPLHQEDKVGPEKVHHNSTPDGEETKKFYPSSLPLAAT